MSTVFYRWGAGRDESRVTFDGTHISVFDLKREIILANKMGNGRDFDIGVYDNVTGEEFKDDNHQVPRSSSLIARRLPSSIKGRGNAQNYIIGTSAADALNNEHRIEAGLKDDMRLKALQKGMRGTGGMFGSMTKRFDGKDDIPGGGSGSAAVHVTTGDSEEDERIKRMFAQSADQWEQTQEDMSMAPRVAGSSRGRPNRPPPSNNGPGSGPSGPGGPNHGGGGSHGGRFDFGITPDKEPPSGYICYRCGQKGHWIQNCPQNDDPATQERKRFVRVTGIPRSFLKTVKTPMGGEGSTAGAMLTADGGFVMAMPDQRQWQQQVAAKPRTLTNAEVRDQEPLDAELTCPICKKLVWEAVRTPCCDTSFCEECITTFLLEHDFECPSCESRVASLDKLKPDVALRERVKGYVEGEIERSKLDVERERAAKGEDGDGDQVEGSAAPEGSKSAEEDGEATEEKEEGERGEVKSEDGNANDSTPQLAATNDQPNPKPKIATAPILDPIKMQEMLNPQIMQTYLTQVHKMLLNPALTPPARLLLQTQMQMVQTSVMQMQMLAASGMLPPLPQVQNGQHQHLPPSHQSQQQQNMQGGGGMQNHFGNGQDPGMGMPMGMNGMNNMNNMNGGNMGMGGMDMNMNMGMGMGMNPQMQGMNGMNGGGMPMNTMGPGGMMNNNSMGPPGMNMPMGMGGMGGPGMQQGGNGYFGGAPGRGRIGPRGGFRGGRGGRGGPPAGPGGPGGFGGNM